MLLYRLQHKQTKKFFCNIRWFDGRITWNDAGAFFRRPDSIRKHLEYLCSEYVAREKAKFPRYTKYAGSIWQPFSEKWDSRHYEFIKKGFKRYKKRLNLYRVVINDIEVKGEKFINADKFIGKAA